MPFMALPEVPTGGPPFVDDHLPKQTEGAPILCGERGFRFALGAKGGPRFTSNRDP
jgi:hypothetical protein